MNPDNLTDMGLRLQNTLSYVGVVLKPPGSFCTQTQPCVISSWRSGGKYGPHILPFSNSFSAVGTRGIPGPGSQPGGDSLWVGHRMAAWEGIPVLPVGGIQVLDQGSLELLGGILVLGQGKRRGRELQLEDSRELQLEDIRGRQLEDSLLLEDIPLLEDSQVLQLEDMRLVDIQLEGIRSPLVAQHTRLLADLRGLRRGRLQPLVLLHSARACVQRHKQQCWVRRSIGQRCTPSACCDPR